MTWSEAIAVGTCPICGHSPVQFVAAEYTESGNPENWHIRSDFVSYGWERDVEAERACDAYDAARAGKGYE